MHVFLATLIASLVGQGLAKSWSVPNVLFQGPSTPEAFSTGSTFDGQKVTPWPNASSYEWWYFDAVSTSSANESLTVVFVETTPRAFDLVVGDSLLSVVFQGTFADGSRFGFQVDVAPSANATIEAGKGSVCGKWHTTGFSFEGTHGLSKYKIEGHNPAYNVSGSMTMDVAAPAHFPCGPNVPGSTELIMPTVYLANAVADSVAKIDFTINGRRLSFTGRGYHDKSWGVQPFRNVVQSWYWGHAQLGPYSLLWVDTLSRSKDEYVSAYVARDGKILLGSCQKGAVKARPFGKNSDFPPQPTSGVPEGLKVEFDLGKEGKLVANITTKVVVIPSDNFIYGRYVGPITGGIVGGPQYKGNAIYEQFKYAS
ncbi:hypothetical protein GQ53DRAFT_752257 [Thozetella sp. PMI_491]|nr:hypothetical protein GQ53DRAFT_752257 [Thozetella sp. PMI_491]